MTNKRLSHVTAGYMLSDAVAFIDVVRIYLNVLALLMIYKVYKKMNSFKLKPSIIMIIDSSNCFKVIVE